MNAQPAQLRPAFLGHPQRRCAALGIHTLAPLAALGVPPPARRIGCWWNGAMAVGVLAVGSFALLPLLSARSWVRDGADGPFPRTVQSVRRQLSYRATALALPHVGLLLWLEPRAMEYLLPGAMAPMLAGLAGTLLALFLVLPSLRRQRWRWRRRSWRAWHAGLFVLLVGLLGWHLLGAGYCFDAPGAVSTLIWLLAVQVIAGGSARQPPLRQLPLRAAPPCL
jgi:hypothetical protein